MRPSDPSAAGMREDEDTLVDQVGQLVTEFQSRDGILPLRDRGAPPLPLEALAPLAPRGLEAPTLDGPVMTAIARRALADSASPLVGLAQPEGEEGRAPRPRPSTMAYGEVEALHPTTQQRLDGSPAVAPDVLCSIPVAGGGRAPRAPVKPESPVQRFDSPRSPLERPSTDALLARLPGPASSWRNDRTEEEIQQMLNLDAPASPPVSRPMGSAHVTSPALTHIGSREAAPRVTFHTHPRSPGPDELDPHQAKEDSRTCLASRVTLLVLALLVTTILLPVHREGALVSPWTALLTPGSTAFTTAAFSALLAAMIFGPIDRHVRAALSTFLGLGLVIFGFLVVAGEVNLGAFEQHPALAAIFGAPLAGRVVLTLCICVLPTALIWRSFDGGSAGARVLLVTGVAMVVYGLFALGNLGVGARPPGSVLLDGALGSPFLGDRVAAILGFVPVVLAGLTLTLLRSRSTGSVSALLGLYWASVIAPLVTLALFVSTATSWTAVLGPLQVVLVLGAGLLLLPAALGELLVILGGRDRSPAVSALETHPA